ncbi:hypothetical protein E2R58_09275 [Paenibacillus amylolyticus]|uniref:hypothetical protein n=1 Tax=Paenibacillus amylolyticus TaxID=1451 RepID=UPI001059D46F|nr:hypothetical protein [Paenibacillus amylolyticus]TDL69345.1 hypothetical protein E2R58_09275 [Paenibacillus amylolyticus]
MEIEAVAMMLSRALYGAANHLMHNQTTKPIDYVKQLVHLLNNGIQAENKVFTKTKSFSFSKDKLDK